MQAISYTLPQLFQDRQALESGDQQLVQRSSQSRIEAQTKTKANLSLVTAEGDTVTISVKSHFRAKLTTYDFLGQKGDSLLSLHAENFRATAKSSVDIKVKGDLNAEEWADIQTLLEKFEELAKEFFSGSIDTGFANILDNGFANILASKDLDTITSFNASLKFSQRIRIKQRAREEFGQAIPSPVSGSVSPGQRPITAESTDQFIDNLVKETQETQLLREQFRQSALADSAHSAGKKFEDILGGLAGLVKSVLDKLADQQDFGTSKRTLATHIRAEFVQKLKFSFRQKETQELGPQSQQPAEPISDQNDASPANTENSPV